MDNTVETITPAKAKQYLGKMVANRKYSEAKSLEYAVLMDEGRWSLNGETIKFNDNDELIDGQHRLQACVIAEKSFKTCVVRGISDEMAFTTIDVGKTRTHGDIFSIAGYPDQNNIAAAGRLIYLVKKDLISISGPKVKRFHKGMGSAVISKLKSMPQKSSIISKDELLEYCAPFKDRLIAANHFASQVKKSKLLSQSTVAGAYFLFCEKSQIDAESFFRDLLEGVGLAANDPVYCLRQKLISNTSAVQKLTHWQLVFFLFKTWHKRRSGSKTQILRLLEGEELSKVI